MKGPSRFGFGESVVFAALAALAFTPVAGACEVRNGTEFGIFYLTVVTAIYVVLLGIERPLSLAALGGVLIAGAASSLASTLFPAAVTLTVALSLARSRFVLPGRFQRPFRVELGVSALAFAVVTLTVSPSYGGISLAIWAFFLAQSAYFLLPTEDSMDSAPEGAQEMGGSR